MTKRDIPLKELILNRYLKKYNDNMLNNLYNHNGCPQRFGYEINCNSNCEKCFNTNIEKIEEQKDILRNVINDYLKILARNNNCEFIPHQEIEV